MKSFVLFLLAALALPAGAGDKLSGSNVDVRTTVTFKVSETAVQKLMPDGWESSPPPAGPFKGFNLAVVLIDSISAQDAEGKPMAPTRSAVLAVPARKKGSDATVTMVVYGITLREGAPGAYGVYAPGQAAVERRVGAGTDGRSNADETWLFTAEDGNAIDLRIQYQRGATVKSKVEQKTYSGARPDFYRIYRWDQVADIVRSTPTGTDRVTNISFKATGPKLGQVFDGAEQVVGVMSIPSYSRMVFLPD